MPAAIIYSTPSCQYCKMAKAFFRQKKVRYKDVDVTTDPENLKEMIEKSGQMGTPVIAIGNKVVVGFDQKAITGLLKAE